MKAEFEVEIYVSYFVDALAIIDKMNITHPDTVLSMDEDKFSEGKCHVIIGDTMFMFLPVHKLFNKEAKE